MAFSKDINIWRKLKSFINTKKILSMTTRQEMGRYIYNGPIPKYAGCGTTFDYYLAALRRLKILENPKRGVYKIKYHIKDHVTITEIQESAYGNCTYKEWFNDIKENNENSS